MPVLGRESQTSAEQRKRGCTDLQAISHTTRTGKVRPELLAERMQEFRAGGVLWPVSPQGHCRLWPISGPCHEHNVRKYEFESLRLIVRPIVRIRRTPW